MHKDTALVFMTNKMDAAVMERFRTIHAQTHAIARSYVLLDAGTSGIGTAWSSFVKENLLEGVTLSAFRITDVAAALSVKLFLPGRMVPGSPHLPLVLLSRKVSHRWFWFVEDDVMFTGDWANLMRMFEADTSDLLCSHVAGYRKDNEDWDWWQTLKAPADALRGSDPVSLVAKGFLPIYRISARALAKILSYQRDGWAGHFEVLIPTVLRHAGFPVKDLNRATPARVYAEGKGRSDDGRGPLASLRFRPIVSREEIEASKEPLIFHPVKSLSSNTRRE